MQIFCFIIKWNESLRTQENSTEAWCMQKEAGYGKQG